MSTILMSLDGTFGREVVGFGLVGLVGFLVHGISLTVLMRSYQVGPEIAWVAAFGLAVAITWALNRRVVFRVRRDDAKRTGIESGLYVLVQLIGALLSFGVFRGALFVFPALAAIPIVALAAGAFVALWFNFIGVRAVVFATSKQTN